MARLLLLLLALVALTQCYKPPINKATRDKRRQQKVVRVFLPSKLRPPPKRGYVQEPSAWDSEYWYHPRIHNFGNIGPMGFLHALLAPISTHLIDRLSYSNIDIRKRVHDAIPDDASVLDLCCGTGFSTKTGAHGVDTSSDMLSVARIRNPRSSFEKGNAESYGEDRSFDIVTCMFATHEMPLAGRRRVLRNAMRVAAKTVYFVDIDPDFTQTLREKPMMGASFLSGEPYVLDYLAHFDTDVERCVPSFTWRIERVALLPKHVVMWRLDRADYVVPASADADRFDA